jgi:predicted enzyme related to lactoylglutathione lyase
VASLPAMERVTGIGGVFFRSGDPDALARWYAEHLGLEMEPGSAVSVFGWPASGGQTVWSAFARDTDYFGSSGQQHLVNYRVADLDAMLAQLRAAGVAVDDQVDESDFGRFGWASDPDGNRFELWQPPEGG